MSAMPRSFALLALVCFSRPAWSDVSADIGGTGGLYTGVAAENIILDGSGSDISDCDDGLFGWVIRDLSGADTLANIPFSTDPLATIDLSSVDGPRTFDIRLTVLCRRTDGDGKTRVTEDTDTGTLEVLNAEPEIDEVAIPDPIGEGEEFELVVDAWDPEPDDAMRFNWTFDNGRTETGSRITVQFDFDGTLGFEVVVEDDDGGTDAFSGELDIENRDPVIECEWVDGVLVDQSWSIRPSATDPGDDILSWHLDPLPETATFDSETGEMQWWPDSTELGQHLFELSVEDGDGGSDRISISVRVWANGTADTGNDGDTGPTSDLARDSGRFSGNSQLTPGTPSNDIGCGCDTGSRKISGILYLILINFMVLTRRR